MRRVATLVLCAASGASFAQVSHEDMNKSNNPLNPAIGVNIQDVYAPKLCGSDAHGWYLRSTGIWTFNPKADDYFIPVGAGAARSGSRAARPSTSSWSRNGPLRTRAMACRSSRCSSA